MAGIADRLGDLSWLGEAYNDMGWVVVEEVAPPEQPEQSVPVAEPTAEELAWSKAKKLLAESDWAMMVDVPMTSPQKSAWIAYRRALREIRLHPDFPNMPWPKAPE